MSDLEEQHRGDVEIVTINNNDIIVTDLNTASLTNFRLQLNQLILISHRRMMGARKLSKDQDISQQKDLTKNSILDKRFLFLCGVQKRQQ
jgi:hypothetical protein